MITLISVTESNSQARFHAVRTAITSSNHHILHAWNKYQIRARYFSSSANKLFAKLQDRELVEIKYVKHGSIDLRESRLHIDFNEYS